LTVTHIAQGCEANHSLFLKSDGSLWAMGYNFYGQLGDVALHDVYVAKQIVASGFKGTAAGGTHSLFLKSDGSLWAVGNNNQGQLGDGTFNDQGLPEQIVDSGVTAIAAGFNHSLFLKSDGSLWAMGDNAFGNLGDGTYSAGVLDSGVTVPEQIVDSDVTAIAAGWGFSLFLKSDGSLWAMGYNSEGALGDGTYSTTYPWGVTVPEQIVDSGVTAIAAGGDHSLFIKSDGSLWAMGRNNSGQLGDGTPSDTNVPEQIVASGVTAISAGDGHSLFVKSDGSLWGMGQNDHGELGDGTWNSTNQPQQIVVGGVTAVAAAAHHSLFLKTDGSLWAMGHNAQGELGDGFNDSLTRGSATPEQIFPVPQPVVNIALSSPTVLRFNATVWFGGEFHLLSSANPALPVSQWTPAWTNLIYSRYTNNFSATIPIAANSAGRQFYILRSQ
jgi:alpha-tubulin suppressor-like RCC1 family protein